MSAQREQTQTKNKKLMAKKSKQKYIGTRAPSREFNDPIYAGLQEQKDILQFNQNHNWGAWTIQRKQANVNSGKSKRQKSIKVKKSQNPIMKITRPHAGFSFNTTDYRNQDPFKNKKSQGQLPQISENLKTVVKFQHNQTPNFHDIKYKSQQNYQYSSKYQRNGKKLKNNFKIRINPMREYNTQKSDEYIKQSGSQKNMKIGKFVYNWGYDQNVDDCLLNYYLKSHQILPSSMSQHKDRKKQTIKENIVRKNLAAKIPSKRILFKQV